MSDSRTLARKPFHLMAKPTGFQCNIACDYCFYLEKETGTLKPRKPQRHMDDATLEAYVRSYIEGTPANEVEFAWQGGEPTLAGIAFYEKALALQAKYAKGKTITNAMQTNGLLIDDTWAAFLARNKFLIGLSVDGPAHLHDAHRVARNGKGVHGKVIEALGHLKRHGVEYNILSVVNSTTAQHPVEIYRYLTRELGATFVQFIPAVEQRTGGTTSGELAHPQTTDATAAVTPWSVSGEDYGRFIIGVFDEWVRNDVGRVYVQLFDNALAAWVGETPSLCVMRRPAAPASSSSRAATSIPATTTSIPATSSATSRRTGSAPWSTARCRRLLAWRRPICPRRVCSASGASPAMAAAQSTVSTAPTTIGTTISAPATS